MGSPGPPQPPQRSGARWAAAIAAGVLIVTPIVAGQEGFVPKAKPDPAGILTGCYGEIVTGASGGIDPARIYSQNECMGRLRTRLAGEYAPLVLKCLPELADRQRRNVFAAMIDAAWNAGPGAVCRSPMATRIRAGHWVSACNAFVGWRVSAGGVVYRGLVKRRRDVERPLCLRPMPSPVLAADYPSCVTIRPAPLLRTPQSKVDFRFGKSFNDKGIS